MKITLEDIFNIPTAVIYYPDLYKPVTSVSIDTRSIKRNSLFVAIKGKRFNGHNYIKEAIKNGATAIVVSNKKVSDLDYVKVPIISVKNTVKTYGELAKIWRKKLPAKVISITGSNGKTTTKEIIAHLLSSKYKVHKTFANNNNQIGVPLTILSAPKNTDFIVLEHGTNHFGEIEYTANIAKPDYALITNIGTSHIKYLGSKEEILKEKQALFTNLNKNGTVFINNSDSFIRKLKKKYQNTVEFGFSGKNDVKAKKKGTTPDGRPKLTIDGFGKSIDVTLPILGESNSVNYLAAVSIALKLKVPKKDILQLTKTLKQVKGRLEKKDFKDFTIIDDTYNANPESVKNAIKVLKNIKSRKNKILILGDMLELGNESDALHIGLAEEIKAVKNISVLTIGKHSKKLNSKLNNKLINSHFFNQRNSLRKHLQGMELSDTVVLIKGSRGMRMEEFADILMERAA